MVRIERIERISRIGASLQRYPRDPEIRSILTVS